MKKRAGILFLCICLVLSVFSLCLAVSVIGNESEEQPAFDERFELMATNPPKWTSYNDYLADEAQAIWNYPEYYIGATAEFNIEWVSSFIVTAGEMAADDEYEYTDFPSATAEDFLTDDGKSIRVVITDYFFAGHDEETGEDFDLWLKVEAAEGYELPQSLQENPYVLQAAYEDDSPSLIPLPMRGMFTAETIIVQKSVAAASRYIEINAADMPYFFDVDYCYDEHGNVFYDLGDITFVEAITSSEYRYVSEADVTLIPARASIAYDKLMAAKSSGEFYQYLYDIPDEVLSCFTEKYKNDAASHIEELVRIENVEYADEVELGEEKLNVTVKGKLPEKNVELKLEAVPSEKVLDEGFDVESEEDITLALDIKLINTEDGSEWQPAEGESVEVSFDMAALGYEDDTVFRLHHKHGDRIERYEVLVVTDGKLTIQTSGFSIYVVEELYDVTGSQITTGNNAEPQTLSVGDEVVYYYKTNNNGNGDPKGTWIVEDPEGAIYYTVHSNVSSEDIGHNMVYAQWIKIVALKETTTPINITFNYAKVTINQYGQSNVVNNTAKTESFKLDINTPKAIDESKPNVDDGRLLYISDTVNESGTITAVLVDKNGNVLEKGLEGAAFSWSRDDKLFIVPQAYENNYKSVNIARDHSGLVEARMKKDETGYKPVTYTLTATLADGTELTDSYTVYYQSEIINASFEFPKAHKGTYNFFPNGYHELYWKTTAPGTGGNITKDIEYGNLNEGDEAEYNVGSAADGYQFAELNAEEFGALYQDIITVPGEKLEWDFAHAARNQLGDTNGMFIVFGPTEAAQKLLDQNALTPLGQAAKNAAKALGTADNNRFLRGEIPVTVSYTYGGATATYTVWYHTVSVNANPKWQTVAGEYMTPEGQYRTRIFFVTDTEGANTNNKNYGNLIDISSAGQYKSYLIEYYEETYTGDGQLQLQYFGSKTESGEALIYSTVDLLNFRHFEEKENDYLYKILINNQTYPYDIRYSGKASLYLEKYPGTSDDAEVPKIDIYEDGIQRNNNYADYDIVMQVYFRDTVIAVQKELILPTQGKDDDGNKIEGMTEEQKLTLLKNLVSSEIGGYKSTFKLTTTTEDNVDFVPEEKFALITKRDPAGCLKSYLALGDNLGDNPRLNATYIVEELKPMELEGLVLKSVEFSTVRYYMGDTLEENPVKVSYDKVIYNNLDKSLQSSPIFLGDDFDSNGQKVSVKIADVKVTNTYEEKMTKIYYHAVGNGKIKKTKASGYEDTPVEELKYYSGKSDGVSVHPGQGASYIYWYRDPECTQRVTEADGVVEADGTFRPNANIINADEVHFYARFETFSIKINRTGADANQSFLYKVERLESAGSNRVVDTMYVTIVCDGKGDGSVSILEVAQGTYRVTEIDEWSWRHPYVNESDSYQVATHTSKPDEPIVFNFSQESTKDEWLNGYSNPKKNIYGG